MSNLGNMMSLPWIFIFFIICLQAERISAHTSIQINNIRIELNGEDIRLKESFKYRYGEDLLAIGNLESKSVEKMKPHLSAVVEALTDNPLRTYFEFLLALCNDYSTLRKLNATTKNIYDFMARSKGSSTNGNIIIDGSVISGSVISGSVQISGNSLLTSGNARLFLATSIQTDEDKIKLEFEKQEEELRKADIQREKVLAEAAKMREKLWETAERKRKAQLDWAAKFTEQMMGSVGKEIAEAMDMDQMDGMPWTDGKDGKKKARGTTKKTKGWERSRMREMEEDSEEENEEVTDLIKTKKKPNRSLNNRRKIPN